MRKEYFTKGFEFESSSGAIYILRYSLKVGWCLDGGHVLLLEDTLSEILDVIKEANKVGGHYFDDLVE